jgi:predicted nucleotidyltransferase
MKIEMNIDKEIIIKNLKRRLAINLKDNLVDVILFGSQLKGDCSADSDYDILIIVKEKTHWKLEREISDICYELELEYGIITDTHILSKNELSSPRGKQPIFYNAINQGYHA